MPAERALNAQSSMHAIGSTPLIYTILSTAAMVKALLKMTSFLMHLTSWLPLLLLPGFPISSVVECMPEVVFKADEVAGMGEETTVVGLVRDVD